MSAFLKYIVYVIISLCDLAEIQWCKQQNAKSHLTLVGDIRQSYSMMTTDSQTRTHSQFFQTVK